MQKLKEEAETCYRCRLHKSRTNVVFGTGPANAKIMLLGEAAGFMEDQTGIPFVGAAGKNLNTLLRTAGLKREDVYITNVLLCRPPRNRDPLPDEIEACRRFLEGHISAIKPKLVITLGRIAARELLSRNVSMGREHGELLDCTHAGVKFKLFLTYHPAAGIYSGATKLKLQADFKKLGKVLRQLKIS